MMRKKHLLAAALAALMLAGCATTTTLVPESSQETEQPTAAPSQGEETPTPEPESPAATPAGEEPQGIGVEWVVEPTIEADNIDVIRLERGNGIDLDYNAYKMFKDDGLCVIEQGGKLGLIDYAGSIVVPVEYTDIMAGYNGQYAMTKDDVNYDTLNGDGSVVPLGENGRVDVVGTSPNRSLYWVLDLNGLYLNSGADGTLESPYTCNVPCAAQGAGQLDEYDCPTQYLTYFFTDGEKPVTNDLYIQTGAYSCGIIPVLQQQGTSTYWGYLNSDAIQTIGFRHMANWTYANRDLPERQQIPYPASYGCVVVTDYGGQYALLAADGTVLIDYGTYERLRPVHGDKLWARQDGKWGVLQLSTQLSESQTGYATLATGVEVEPDVIASRNVVADADDGLVLRAGPGTDYAKLGSVPSGRNMQVLGTSSSVPGWLYVDQGGWVSEEFVLEQ